MTLPLFFLLPYLRRTLHIPFLSVSFTVNPTHDFKHTRLISTTRKVQFPYRGYFRSLSRHTCVGRYTPSQGRVLTRTIPTPHLRSRHLSVSSALIRGSFLKDHLTLSGPLREKRLTEILYFITTGYKDLNPYPGCTGSFPLKVSHVSSGQIRNGDQLVICQRTVRSESHTPGPPLFLVCREHEFLEFQGCLSCDESSCLRQELQKECSFGTSPEVSRPD